MSETQPPLYMTAIEIGPPDPDAVKARLDVQAESWARPDAMEHRDPAEEVAITYDALNCIHYLQSEIITLRAQLEEARAKAIEDAITALRGIHHYGEYGESGQYVIDVGCEALRALLHGSAK